MSSSTTSHGKQFTLYVSAGPNPWKVVIILEELCLAYKTVVVDVNNGENKAPEFTKLNPNGRLPALVDHSNNDFTIWESGAIILYLVGKYDTEHKISFPDFDSTATANQYLMFQMSGQGPYMGQLGWFLRYHHEKIPSAIERYRAETMRIMGVLEKVLEGKQYMVNDKPSYADLAFVPYQWAADWIKPELDGWRDEFPTVAAWSDRLEARDSVKKCKAVRAECGF
ncbi:glutathione S-transferase C-terminal-like protein [Morchella conica CCBAS932]|uniref:Glutathione S-transferase C-terminal-like protein n=1 Tax=Morchella conica CCBAS932 TaxID=1392247 RepID=A0A3N4KHF5_9PEZI|nr:glutathione S-transferase C-terminal-like protein [Morchella conica CCBAS932]